MKSKVEMFNLKEETQTQTQETSADKTVSTEEKQETTKPEADTKAETKAESKTKPETEAETKAKPETEAETKAESDSENTPSDEEKIRRKKRRRIFDVIRYIAIVACLAVIAYEGYKIISHKLENKAAEDEYANINDSYVQILDDPAATADADAAGTEEVDTEKYPNLIIDFEGLAEVNPDFIGWLYFPAVELSYPVVQEQKIDEYLNKTFQGQNNGSGAVFMDIVSNPKFTGLNNILFAHHMINKSMFGILPTLAEGDNYKKLEKMPYFYIYTKNAVFRYYVYGFYGSPKDGVVYSDIGNDRKKYNEMVRYIKENNKYRPKEEVNFGTYPELLQLSTCYYTDNPRFLVGGAKDHTWYIGEDGDKTAEEYYQDLRDECVTVKEGDKPTDIEISVDTKKLDKINENNAGWLYFPALTISYPIAVETKANEYLSRTFFKENDGAGSLFVDMESDPELGGYSNMIFGHSHTDGTMYGSFEQLIDDEGEQLKDNPYFYIVNEKGTYKFKAVACWKSDSGDKIYSIVTNGDIMKEVVDHVMQVNVMENGTELEEMDYTEPTRMMTLTTCSDFGDKTRMLLSGVLVESPEDEDTNASEQKSGN